MTPKEKAFELYKMYNNILIEDIIDRRPTYLVMTHKMAKKSALIAVNEIIQAIRFTDAKSDLGYVGYWKEIKKEIEKI